MVRITAPTTTTRSARTCWGIVGASVSVLLLLVLVVVQHGAVQEEAQLRKRGLLLQQTKSSSNPAISTSTPLKDPPLLGDLRQLSARDAWDKLTQQASVLMKNGSSDSPPLKVMEVGMHRADQCIHAAQHGLDAHCVEPSPSSFGIIQKAVAKQPADVQERIHLVQKAASDTTGQVVPFWAGGGTGDHVGSSIDMWTMQDTATSSSSSASAEQTKPGQKIEVATTRLDDLVQDDHYYLIKVDTQGFEPAVFAGLERTLSHHQADYVVMEFWPKGMDLLLAKTEAHDRCLASTRILQRLQDAGYRLYPLSVEAHPKAPREALRHIRPKHEDRPLHDLSEHCLWYYHMEQRFPSDTSYQMGYWSDIVAVAPGVTWLPRSSKRLSSSSMEESLQTARHLARRQQ